MGNACSNRRPPPAHEREYAVPRGPSIIMAAVTTAALQCWPALQEVTAHRAAHLAAPDPDSLLAPHEPLAPRAIARGLTLPQQSFQRWTAVVGFPTPALHDFPVTNLSDDSRRASVRATLHSDWLEWELLAWCVRPSAAWPQWRTAWVGPAHFLLLWAHGLALFELPGG